VGERIAAPVGVETFRLSRPALEDLVRARLRAMRRVSLIGGADVRGALYDRSERRFCGAAWTNADGASCEATADLVVDARGRGSRVAEWLRAHGERPPAEERIEIGLSYVTRIFRADPSPRGLIVGIGGPAGTRIGAAFPLEGGRLMATLGGYCGDAAPRDSAGFLGFARTLASPELAATIEPLEPLDEARVFQTPASIRRHFERDAAPPAGLIVLGDALCAFNPVFGQGMSSAAMQAEGLAATLEDPAAARSGSAFAWSYYARASRAVDLPWQLAAGQDFRVPGVRGVPPAGLSLRRRFGDRLELAATRDAEVAAAMTRVAHLLAPMSSLFAPRSLARILTASRTPRGAPFVRSASAAGE
jgi:2-polyprenyl-6-methoxyphenol hydroxylase-like FAD-dependent oxidoreductase